MKQYKSIDLFKFLGAFLIIILHTAPFSSYSKVLTFGLRNIITPIAVPFFFVASGFLTCEKSDYSKEYMKRYALRLLQLYLIWSAIYFVFVVIKWLRNAFSYTYVLEYIKDFFFEGSYSTIWFLPALLSATVFVYFLHKKFSYTQIFKFSLIIYVFTLFGSSYYGLTMKIPVLREIFKAYYSFFDSIKNGLLFGLPYVSMGAMISEQKDNIKFGSSSKKKQMLTIAVLWAIMAIEELFVAFVGWNGRGVDTVFMLIPLSYFMFVFIINLELPDNKAYTLFRKYSLLIFLSQRIPLTVIELWLSDTVVATNSVIFSIVVIASTFLISYVIIKLSEKKKLFKYLY